MAEFKDDYSKILNTFVQKRKKAMTEQDIANALGVSKATISNFEANKRQNFDLLECYANIFGNHLNIRYWVAILKAGMKLSNI